MSEKLGLDWGGPGLGAGGWGLEGGGVRKQCRYMGHKQIFVCVCVSPAVSFIVCVCVCL